MQLNLYENHFSLITDFERFCGVFKCSRCDVLWYGCKDFLRHCRSCLGKSQVRYSGGVYHNPKTVFKRLQEMNFRSNRSETLPLLLYIDLECLFSQQDLPDGTDKLQFTARHIAMSFSVASCIPGEEAAHCEISDGDTAALVAKLVNKLENAMLHTLLKVKYEWVFEV